VWPNRRWITRCIAATRALTLTNTPSSGMCVSVPLGLLVPGLVPACGRPGPAATMDTLVEAVGLFPRSGGARPARNASVKSLLTVAQGTTPGGPGITGIML
jgi:hypothetical protein